VAYDALRRAVGDHGAPSPGGDVPFGARVVEVDVWRDYAQKVGMSTGDAEAQRKAFYRARIALQGKGRVAMWGSLVWVVR
jgi:hypothetical protein